ncbi:VanZ family protein [Neglectibacter caecimuris]|uniref:VanZ family protein n=1 Tax=Neglectibacter caecimuris TaxID=3093658 RepID=UPI002AC8C75D|nr:VanZ family protein [Neglectibacter sp. M00184]
MSGYTEVIFQALVLFPLAALLITMPFLIHHYRKFGSITFPRVFLVYSFVLYLMCAYFLVILPLPDKAEVAKLTSPTTQLLPFSFFRELSRETDFLLTAPSTWFPALTSNFTLQFVFNIALLFPLGFYLRYYFRRKALGTAVACFCVSLFFELTQLSGLYGIYPRPYRLFDVDDLLCNTLGGMLGYFITGIFLKILPDREKIDERSYQKGMRVTFPRRLLSFCVDLLFVFLLSWPVGIGLAFVFLESYAFAVSYLLYFILLQWLWKGKSLGKRLTKLCVVDESGHAPSLGKLTLRYGFLWAAAVAFSLISDLISDLLGSVLFGAFLQIGLSLAVLLWFLVDTVQNHNSVLGRDYLHGRLSKTKLSSTVRQRSNDFSDGVSGA